MCYQIVRSAGARILRSETIRVLVKKRGNGQLPGVRYRCCKTKNLFLKIHMHGQLLCHVPWVLVPLYLLLWIHDFLQRIQNLIKCLINFQTQHLKKLFPKSIYEDHTGYVKKGFIEFYIRPNQDAIDYPGITLNLDGKFHSIADETTLFCKNKNDIISAMNAIEIFGSFSGLLINRNTKEGLWIGNLKSFKDKIAGINWGDKPNKALGVLFGHDKEEIKQKNGDCKIEKMIKMVKTLGKKSFNFRENHNL